MLQGLNPRTAKLYGSYLTRLFTLAKKTPDEAYSLAIEFQTAEPLTSSLEIVNISSSRDSFGFLTMVGEVKNNGDTISEYTEVFAIFYAADGKVVDVGYAFTDPSTVQPRSQQSFKLIPTSDPQSNLATRWALDTQSNQYASIPETTWPTLMLAAALSLCGFAMRKRQAWLPGAPNIGDCEQADG